MRTMEVKALATNPTTVVSPDITTASPTERTVCSAASRLSCALRHSSSIAAQDVDAVGAAETGEDHRDGGAQLAQGDARENP